MKITFPNLTGSEKQISWADKIRTEKIDLMLKMHTTLINQYNGLSQILMVIFHLMIIHMKYF